MHLDLPQVLPDAWGLGRQKQVESPWDVRHSDGVCSKAKSTNGTFTRPRKENPFRRWPPDCCRPLKRKAKCLNKHRVREHHCGETERQGSEAVSQHTNHLLTQSENSSSTNNRIACMYKLQATLMTFDRRSGNYTTPSHTAAVYGCARESRRTQHATRPYLLRSTCVAIHRFQCGQYR